jgi:hypothetical protein
MSATTSGDDAVTCTGVTVMSAFFNKAARSFF